MEPVIQKHDYGCAVASVANILGISYRKSLSLFGSSAKNRAKSTGFYCKDIIQALKVSGLEYEFKYIKPRLKKKIYENGVGIYLRRSKKYPAGHFLVRKNSFWYDSWINFPNENRIAGIRKRLPGKPIYMIYPCGDGGL